jgi:hypothetical protein
VQKKLESKSVPFRGGCKTSVEPALLDGQYSMVQNFRNQYPGMIKRAGQIKLHTTADSTNKVLSMYQFVKGKKTERHFYAQMSDSDVLEATAAPPTVTTGVFGSEVFSGTASPVPASWANVNDLLLFANGVDTPQIYPGTASPVEMFIVYKGAAAIPTIPEIGDDYTTEVTDGDATTFAVLDSLGDLSVDFDCIFVMTPVPISALNFTVKSANGTASTTGCNYWNGSAWTAVASFADGTDSGGKAFAVSGAMTWTLPTAHKSSFMYGVVGFWYQVYLATGDLDSETEVSAVTYESSFQNMSNVWDGNLSPVVESQVYNSTSATYAVFGGGAIDVGGVGYSGDLIYIASAEPICAIIVDVASDPATSTIDIATVKYWNGAWTTVTGLVDGTDGLSRSGWLTFAHQSDVQKYRFNGSVYYAYWYQITPPSWNAVSCLNFNGDDAAQTTTDLSGKTWTFYNTAQLDTAQKKYGTASLLLDGNSDYITTPVTTDFNFGTGDFTVEWWWRVDDLLARYYSYVFSIYLDTNNYFYVYSDCAQTTGSTIITCHSNVGGSPTITYVSGAIGTMAADTWYHFAVVRKGGVIQSFFNGAAKTKIDTGCNGATYYGGTLYVGRFGTSYTTGWLDDVRIAKAAAYPFGADFTVPTELGLPITGVPLPNNMTLSAYTQPYFDIADIGKAQTICSWKNRASISTNLDHYMYLSAENQPQVIYGVDTAILSPGDGRYNRPVAQKKMSDDLFVWQEEKGMEGGCLTKYSWVSSVDDIRKTLISSTLGVMNAKSVDVADGVEMAELNRDIPVMSIAFCLSRSGVYVTDGNTCYMISGDISNYFDPTSSVCIRKGYESEMWLKYDSAYGVVRIGLVSGASATLPNVFPVYDIKDKTWSFDVLEQELSCMTECEAGSGTASVLQVGGGVDDGQVYLLNSGLNDIAHEIDSFATAEFDTGGDILQMDELMLRMKVQSAGLVTVTPSLNSIAWTSFTLAQTAETANQTIRRHRKKMSLTAQHISLKIQHNTAGESCLLEDMRVKAREITEQ